MNKVVLQDLEKQRLRFQSELDSVKTQLERNKLGQFATPPSLALDVLKFAESLLPKNDPIRFLEPAFGTGSFYYALLNALGSKRIEKAQGYEIDNKFWETAHKLWSNSGIQLLNEDFTCAIPPNNNKNKFNLIISNPPYVRHHHIDQEDKLRLQKQTHSAFDGKISGLAGLYCYFMGIAHDWLQEDGIAGWLIPSEFMDVNYGQTIKKYLLNKVTLIQIHRFNPDNVQFNDALVSSSVVWFRKGKPSNPHNVLFSYGGSLASPEIVKPVSLESLKIEDKWTRIPFNGVKVKSNTPTIGDFFKIRRGLATGDNKFFILDNRKIKDKKIPRTFLKPILPSPRFLNESEINSDKDGIPQIENPLFLLDCRLPEHIIKEQYPNLWSYYQEGIEQGVHERYLCKHRSPWYSQEQREAPIFACTYIGRPGKSNKSPFRFILNHSKATITNTFLGLYPKADLANAIKKDPSLKIKIWKKLNEIPTEELINEGRVYGGGMYKLEPRELKNVPAEYIKSYTSKLLTLF